MKYLFDTNMAIYAIKNDFSVLRKLRSVSPDDVAISTMSVAEMRFGCCKSKRPKSSHLALANFLAPWNIIDFDESATSFYGELRFYLKSKGLPIGERDMIIASIALSRGLVVVTNDKDYSQVPDLAIENWSVK